MNFESLVTRWPLGPKRLGKLCSCTASLVLTARLTMQKQSFFNLRGLSRGLQWPVVSLVPSRPRRFRIWRHLSSLSGNTLKKHTAVKRRSMRNALVPGRRPRKFPARKFNWNHCRNRRHAKKSWTTVRNLLKSSEILKSQGFCFYSW